MDKMRKTYSKYALAVIIFGLVTSALQLFNVYCLHGWLNLGEEADGWFPLLNTIIPMYCIGFPLLSLIISKNETVKPEKHKMSFGRFLLCIPLVAALMGVGGVIGVIMNILVTAPFGLDVTNNTAVGQVMLNSNPVIRILTVGFLAPVVEEFIFRKFLIDRVYRYGEWVAILTSGLMFGLFHENLAQFFFATLIGCFFAFIYIRTGTVWYSVGLHMIINLSTSVITMGLLQPYLSMGTDKMQEYSELSRQYLMTNDPALAERINELAAEVLPKMLPFSLWMGFLTQIVFVGIVLWIIFLAKKKFHLKPAPDQVRGGMKYAWGSVGMILFVIYCLAEGVFNMFQLVRAAG